MAINLETPALRAARTPLYIHHPVAEMARRQVYDALSSPRPAPFIALVGGAGTGKSTMLDQLHAEALAEAAPLMAADPSVLPVGRGRVPSPKAGRFNWHAFADTVRTAFQLPSASRGIGATGGAGIGNRRFLGRQAKNASEAISDAASDVVLREGRLLFLDEANHLGVMADQKRSDVQFDALKDFAAEAGLTLVLVGTYDLLKLPHASAQLGRRTEIVHLRPYDLGVARDRSAFTQVVARLADEIGDTLPIDEAWVDELHAGSAGCVGLLVDWLLNAAAVHRTRGGSSALRASIRAKRWPTPYLAEVRDELALGQAAISGGREAVAKLLRHAEFQAALDHPPVMASQREYKAPITANGQKLKPGERRPARIPCASGAA